MDCPPLFMYVGSNSDTISFLQKEAARCRCLLKCVDYTQTKAADLVSDWHCVLLLEMNVAEQTGLNFLREINQAHAGMPVIVIGDPSTLTLTQIANARFNGAHGFVFEPSSDSERFPEMLDAAILQLQRWHLTLDEFSQESERSTTQ